MAIQIVEQMITHLKKGDFQTAVSLFIKGQNEGVFPGDHTLVSKLVTEIGENSTGKLITAFSHYPCQFCKKGRTKCKDCDGHGHINHKMVCEVCMGLGNVRCDFCNGSGWMAIEDIPDGLRLTILLARARTAMTRIKAVLAKPIPQISESNPLAVLKECAQILIYFDRYVGVLENVVVVAEKINVPDGNYKARINKMYQRCIETAIKGVEHIRDVVGRMAEAAGLEAESADKDSDIYSLANKRFEFYKNMAAETNVSAFFRDEHPFLEKAIERYIAEKHQK